MNDNNKERNYAKIGRVRMGKVTEFILNFVREKINEYKFVVWYDPDLVYGNLLSELRVDDIHIFKYDGSFLELRYKIEPYLKDFLDLKVLIYLPIERIKDSSPMIEAEVLGVILEPSGAKGRNTRLTILAKKALKSIIPPDNLNKICKDVELCKIKLKDLDKLAEEGTGEFGVIKLIFGTSDIVEVVLSVVGSNQYDNEIKKRQVVSELLNLFKFRIGFKSSSSSFADIKDELVRYILVSDFIASIGGLRKVTSLESVPQALEQIHVENVIKIASTWRNRFDLQQSYIEGSEKVEIELGIESLTIDIKNLLESVTFPYIEKVLQKKVQEEILDNEIKSAKIMVEKRSNSFWSLAKPENGLKWNLLGSIVELLYQLVKIKMELKSFEFTGTRLVKAYCDDSGWYIIDSLHRKVEKQYFEYSKWIQDEENLLEQIVSHTRNEYFLVVSELINRFLNIIEKESLNIKGIESQSKIFYRFVKPFIGREKIAYFLVDALRYEMGTELINGIDIKEASIYCAIACIPTITEFGMAALLPKANENMQLIEAKNNKLEIQIDKIPLRNRKNRVSFLQNIYEDSCVVLKLENILKMTKATRKKIDGKELVVITSQEIDELGAIDNIALARKIMSDILGEIKHGIRNLYNLGFTRFVITSDHGYIFYEDIRDDLKINSPGGQRLDLHRRYWIGKGGADSENTVRIKASVLGWTGDFDFIFPKGLAFFKVIGSSQGYFHGGISLQEVIIPIIDLKFEEKVVKRKSPAIFKINIPRKVITTRFFTVTINFYPPHLFYDEIYKIRLSIREDKNEVGDIVTAVYGFDENTKEITLKKEKENHITIMLTKEIGKGKTISIYLLDAKTGKELEAIKDIEVSISI